MRAERWTELTDALRAVLDRPAEDRRTVLAAVCGTDRELRAQLDSLLDHEAPAAAFLEPPAGEGGRAPGADPDARELHAGARIGPYRLERLLGTGGMGAVWLAERADDQFQMQVALKVVKAGLDSDEVLRRFRAERQVLARLQHPHIARLLDGGATGQGRPFLVMEYVEGMPIHDYCRRHGLTVTARLELFRKVCGAVEFAHRSLVVHRDIKPGNILVTAGGEPKLLDFGIAKALDLAAADDGLRTGAAACLTPRYASPEQVRGEPITTASDVYSLGVVLYELLTGCEPYPHARSRAELARDVCETEPVRPSEAVGRTGGPGRNRLARRLRGDLDGIVSMALRKEATARYPSAERLDQDLERHLRGLPVLARRGTLRYRTAKLLRRHAVVATAMAAVLASLVIGVVATADQAAVSLRERNAALVAQRRERDAAARAERAAHRSARVARFLQRVLAAADPRVSGRGTSIAEALDQAAATVQEEFGSDPQMAAAVHDTIGLTWLDLGRFTDAERELRAALALQERPDAEDASARAETLRIFGRLHYARGDLTDARQATERALAIDRGLHDGAHEDVAMDLNNLGAIARRQGDHDVAGRLLDEALAMRRALFGDRHVAVAETLNNLSALSGELGRVDDAERLAREVLAMRRALLGDDHADTLQSLDNLAVLLARRHEYANAEPLMAEVVARSRGTLGEDHPELAVSLSNLGNLRSLQGDDAGAEPLFLEALRIRQHAFGPGDDATVRCARRLARCRFDQQRFAAAELILSETLGAVEQAPGDHSGSVAELIQDLVELATIQGRPDRAAELRSRQRPRDAGHGSPRKT